MYRMKQNAVGLANICILSTGVLLVLSTTVSIYSGVLDIIHTRYPWEISIHGENQTKENCMEMEKTVKEVSEVTGLAVEQEQTYESLSVMLIQKDQELVPYQEGASMNPMGVSCVTKDTYNKMSGSHITLAEKEAAVFVERGSLTDQFVLMGDTYHVRERLDDFPVKGPCGGAVSGFCFIPASNEPSSRTCADIWRLPRGSNTPLLCSATSLMPRCLQRGL